MVGPSGPEQHQPPALGQRPPMVVAASVLGAVAGGIGVLDRVADLFDIGLIFRFDAFLGLLTLLSLAAAVVLLVGGIQALQGRSPRLLLLGSYASIAAALLYTVWGLVSGWGFLFVGFLTFVMPIAVIVLLWQQQSRQYYATQGMSY